MYDECKDIVVRNDVYIAVLSTCISMKHSTIIRKGYSGICPGAVSFIISYFQSLVVRGAWEVDCRLHSLISQDAVVACCSVKLLKEQGIFYSQKWLLFLDCVSWVFQWSFSEGVESSTCQYEHCPIFCADGGRSIRERCQRVTATFAH